MGEFRSRIQQAQEALVRPRRRRVRAALWLAAAAAAITLVTAPWWLPSREDAVLGTFEFARTIAKGASLLPSRSDAENTLPNERTAALQQFEENLTDLIEAHKQALRQTPDGGPPPAELTEKIARLEARDPVAARAAAVWLRQSRLNDVNARDSVRAAVLHQFEENLTALLEARKRASLQTPAGGSPPADLAAEIARLEARDRELRELIRSSDRSPVGNSAPPTDTPPNR